MAWCGGGGGGRGTGGGGGAGAPPRHGRAAPRFFRANGGGGARSASRRGASRGRVGGRSRPDPFDRPPSTLPPLQVPSAFRRGGLKTLGGSPVRPGSGADGPAGFGEARSSSPAAPPPTPPPAVAAPGAAFPGGGVGGAGTPGRLWGARARPRGAGARAPRRRTAPTPRESVLVSRWPAGGAPPLPSVCGAGRGIVPCQGLGYLPRRTPRKKRKKRETLTTLSGGSLGSCVDEERS